MIPSCGQSCRNALKVETVEAVEAVEAWKVEAVTFPTVCVKRIFKLSEDSTNILRPLMPSGNLPVRVTYSFNSSVAWYSMSLLCRHLL